LDILERYLKKFNVTDIIKAPLIEVKGLVTFFDEGNAITICSETNYTPEQTTFTILHECAEIEAAYLGLTFRNYQEKERYCHRRASEMLVPSDKLEIWLTYTDCLVTIKNEGFPYCSFEVVGKRIGTYLGRRVYVEYPPENKYYFFDPDTQSHTYLPGPFSLDENWRIHKISNDYCIAIEKKE